MFYGSKKQWIMLLAPPGGGKGTQFKILSDMYNFYRIESGSLAREQIKKDSAYAARAKTYIERGQIFPDDMILPLVGERLRQAPDSMVVYFDGIPRRGDQCRELLGWFRNLGFSERGVVVVLHVEDEVCLRRIKKRAAEGPARFEERHIQVRLTRLAEYRLELPGVLRVVKDLGMGEPMTIYVEAGDDAEVVSRQVSHVLGLCHIFPERRLNPKPRPIAFPASG